MTIDLRDALREPRQMESHQPQILDATPRHSSARARRDHQNVIIFLIVLTALGSIFLSSASPAGIALADAAYRAAFGAGVVWFASRSRRWTWTVLAGFAALSASGLFVQIAALCGLVVAAHTLRIRRRHHLAGAVVAALSMPALLTQGVGPIWRLSGGHLEDPFAMSAVITLLATVPIFRSGWRTLSRRKRRQIRQRFRYSAWAVVSILIGTGIVCAAAVPPMLRGLEETRSAAESAQSGRLDLATLNFSSATSSWERSNNIVSGPWMVPARLVPILGQHIRAAQVVSGQASAITEAAATATSRVDPDALFIDGAIDLDEIDRITPAMDAFAATLDRATDRIARTQSPWIIPPVAERIDRASAILGPASGVVGAGAEALHVGTDLLGKDRPANILIMFSTPAEARGSGGFVGSWAVVRSTDGRMEIAAQYRTRELNQLLAENNAQLRADPDYVARYGRFGIERHIQDVTMSPHFPSVAPVAADLFEQATQTPIDAVLSIDPFVLRKLLQFSGPLERSTGEPLSSNNVIEDLLFDQYSRFGDDEVGRESELSDLTTTLVDTLLASPPDPIAFATALAPLADQQRIALWLADDFDGSIAERLGLDGALPAVDGDFLSIVHQNAGQNKIDSFLKRDVTISTTLNPQWNTVEHDVTITLDNSAPTTGFPDAILASNDQGLDVGTNRMLLSVYTAVPVLEARVDGDVAPLQSETELGRFVYSIVVTIPSGDFVNIDLSLAGTMDLTNGYRMTLGAQPGVQPDALSWHVLASDGGRLNAPVGWTGHSDGVRWAAPLDKNKAVEITIDG